MIEEQEARRDLLKAEQDYWGALEELSALGVQSLDAVQGMALVPFVHDDQSAWYFFDLFDSQPIRSWCYQSDPEQTRHPLTALRKLLAETTACGHMSKAALSRRWKGLYLVSRPAH